MTTAAVTASSGGVATTVTTTETTSAAANIAASTVFSSVSTVEGATSSVTSSVGAEALNVATSGGALLSDIKSSSLVLAPICWILLGGAWVWRGRVRARYSQMGFGSDVFELFMKMKGGATRIRVLNTLNTPKDRLQLAEELGVDWKTVDRHVQILNRYGFVREQAAYGTVRLYEVTPMGKMLLNLFREIETTDGPTISSQAPKGIHP
jgi:hypothetical protein